MCQRIALFVALVVLQTTKPTPTTPLTERYPFRAPYPLEKRGITVQGIAQLTVCGYDFRIGDKIRMDIRFTNHGGDGDVYNPFFGGLYPAPGGVAVYDSKHQYIGMYPGAGGSQGSISRDTWIYLASDGYVGTTLSGLAGHVPGTRSSSADHPLPPGRYYLQAVFFNAFIGLDAVGRHMLGPEDGDKLREHFDTNELCRSNVVEIRLLERE